MCNFKVVHYTEQNENIGSDFDKCFQDFALLKPIATFVGFPFGEDTEVDSLVSKIATLLHMNSSALEVEILSLQTAIKLKSQAMLDSFGTYSQRKSIQM